MGIVYLCNIGCTMVDKDTPTGTTVTIACDSVHVSGTGHSAKHVGP